ncbi:hypothetical protein AMATHDRAFT_10457 [Amanita thiersii Skay4041]|uniref:Uncharacterized protein n=1 Tax=Amanita thiersii Skay4041 TaxID=703135 RepID=A0A2A9N9P3_9AGAR|nr:hypothetical protein AMATHDRAFT_10457 [Amanita thiersii Skay4041]
MEALKDAPQVTIDSFFEVQENCFLVWTLSKTLLKTYGKEITWLMPFMETATSSPPEDKQKKSN